MFRHTRQSAPLVATLAICIGAPAHATLVTLMHDDFTAGLGQWDLDRINAPGFTDSSVTIDASNQMFIDSEGGSANRGWLVTNATIPDSASLATLAGSGNVGLRIAYDAIDTPGNPRAAGGMLLGAAPYNGDPDQNIGGAKLFDGTAENNSPTGENNTILVWLDERPYYSSGSANLQNIGPTHNYGEPAVGKRVRLDWISNGSELATLQYYLDDNLVATVNAPNVQFQAGAVGFYVALDRDLVLDNFTLQAVPEPASLAMLGLGATTMLLRRR